MNPHHGSKSFDDAIAAALARAIGDGLCSDKYPEGKIAPSDEGSVGMAVASHGDRVIVHFAEPCHWIAMGSEDAMLFAQTLIDKARQAGLDGPAVLTLGGKDGD